MATSDTKTFKRIGSALRYARELGGADIVRVHDVYVVTSETFYSVEALSPTSVGAKVVSTVSRKWMRSAYNLNHAVMEWLDRFPSKDISAEQKERDAERERRIEEKESAIAASISASTSYQMQLCDEIKDLRARLVTTGGHNRRARIQERIAQLQERLAEERG